MRRIALFEETSRKKIIWDIFICSIALATGLFLPLEILKDFSEKGGLANWWRAFSVFGLIDMLVTFNTSLEIGGRIIRDRREIARQYFRGLFVPDLLANLPFFVITGVGVQTPWVALLLLLRLSKLVHVTSRWEDLQLLHTPVIRLIRYGITLMLITNGITCLWLWVGLLETGPEGWIQRLQLSRSDFFDLYLHSLYWTVTTLATVGYGDITPKTHTEIFLAVIMMMTGAVLLAFAVGNVVSIISSLDRGRTEYLNRQSAISSYLRRNGVDGSLLKRVRRFYEYQWMRNQGVQPEQILKDLPEELRTEITLFLLQDAVNRIPLFTYASKEQQKKLLSCLYPVCYPPETVLLDIESIGEKIVFITSGSVCISTPENLPHEIKLYGSSDYVGDLSFFLREKRTASVITLSYVEAFVLSRGNFDKLITVDLGFKDLIKKVAGQQSQRNQVLLLAGVIV